MPKELKRYGLRTARKALPLGPLATVVRVTGKDGKEQTAFIGYSADFLVAVGLRLSRGVSSHDPAYLRVMPKGDAWGVWAFYLRETTGTLLWQTEVFPSWLKLNPVHTP